jgi:Na+-transporting NADH:ubiquinone oxidoreductase subunit NqrE
MICNFNAEKCSPECKNFGMCSYLNIQKQVNTLQGQINTLFSVVTESVKTTAELQEKLMVYTKDMLQLISEMRDTTERHIENNEN